MNTIRNQITDTSRDRFVREFSTLTNASVSVIAVRTREPYRALGLVKDMATATPDCAFRYWTMNDGWVTFNHDDPNKEESRDGDIGPLPALHKIDPPQTSNGNEAGFPYSGYYAMMWPHFVLKDAKLPPFLQLLAHYSHSLTETLKRVILVVPFDFSVPSELEDCLTILDLDLPGATELREIYQDMMENLEDSLHPDYDETDIDRIVNAGLGMTSTEFENSVARALVDNRKGLPELDISIFSGSIMKIKTEVVKRSDVLEVMPPASMSDVGGLENLKSWTRLRRHCFTEEAAEFGVDQPKGCALIGPPGCVAEGTMIGYRRGECNSYRRLPVEVLYDKYNALRICPGAQWRQDIDTFVQSRHPETGEVFYNRVTDIFDKGVKVCIRIKTDVAGDVTLTDDHPVLISDGSFVAAGNILAGDTLLVRGSMKPVATGGRVRRDRVVVEGLNYYDAGWTSHTKDPASRKAYEYKRQHRARLMLEAHMNHVDYETYIRALREDKDHNYVTLGSEYDVHHIDEDPTNDALDNLQALLREDHYALHHDLPPNANLNIEHTVEAVVEYVEVIGKRRTFDLSMDHPAANFVVNDGIIVHNTGKSLSAKAIAHELGLPLIKFDVSRVFSSLVGQSEGKVRAALKQIDAMAPCVAFLDELDKAFDMHSGGGDSGVGKRVLGAILTHMQESDKSVFWVMTANRTDGLPPEMLRKGRLDEVFSVSVPSDEEREEILRIHLNKRGWGENDIEDIATAVSRSQGYVPAEIEAAVKEAITIHYAKWVEDGRPAEMPALTGDHIAEQLSEMRPLSEAFKEQFAAMQSWAENNARPANKQQIVVQTKRQRPASGGRRKINAGDLDG